MAKRKVKKPTQQFKNPWGRPTKFKEEYHNQFIEHCAKGGTVVTFCSELNITRDTLYGWKETVPGFSDTFKRARQATNKWWFNLLRTSATGMPIKGARYQPNLGAIAFAMKNVCGWSDNPEQVGEEVEELVFE